MSIPIGPTGTIPYPPSCFGRTTYDMTQEMQDDLDASTKLFGDAFFKSGELEMLETDDHGGGKYTLNFRLHPPTYRPLASRKPLPSEV